MKVNEDEIFLKTDEEKCGHLFELIATPDIQDLVYERIGKPQAARPRILKVKLQSKDVRHSVLAKAKILKTKSSPWNKAYVKKDLHFVYRKENKRVQDMKKEHERNNPENHEIKLVNGVLYEGQEIIT